jgi:predicted phage terminase large subunit-like protein
MTDALQAAQERVDIRARCKHDKLFLADILGYDFQPCHVDLFSNFIQYKEDVSWVEQSTVKDRLILHPRGHYKTTAIVVEVIQQILNNPEIAIILMQGSLGVTKTLLKQVQSHFTGEAFGSRFGEIFPDFCGDKKALHASAMSFTTTARTRKQTPQATVTVASPRSIKTGQHYQSGFFDDLVNESNYRNPKLLQKTLEDFTLAGSLIDPGCYRCVTGTRYSFGDTYEEIMRWQAASGKWLVDVKNCWDDLSQNLPDAEKKPRFPRFKKRNGELGGFTMEELLQMQKDDVETFSCQYLNRPVHASKQAYTNDLLHSACIPSADSPALSQAIIVVDLASGDTAHADDSVITVGKIDTLGTGYLVDMRGDQWVPMETAMNCIDMCLRHRPVKILFENTASCKYFVDFLRVIAHQKGVYLPIDLIKVNTTPNAKNIRVISLAGVIKRGKFKFFAGLSKFQKLVEQACEFPKGRHGHDDYIDTAALLYIELSKEMLSLPMRPASTNPILAMISDRENALVKTLTENELQEVSAPDLTGLE